MKIRNIVLCTIAILFAVTSCGQNAQGEFKSVNLEEFKKAISDTSAVVLVDVRTADEHAQGNIPGTKCNIDVLKEDFESIAVESLPKEKTIAIYCRSGRRSKNAGAILTKNGYNVVELSTGYNGWK
jgi:rhodanese-related sulfurtransferase